MYLDQLPKYLLEQIVDYLPMTDLHRLILADKDTYDVVHTMEPKVWKSLNLMLSKRNEEELLPARDKEIKQNIKHRRYRCASSLTVKGTWSDELLAVVVDCINKQLTELILDASQYIRSAGGIKETLLKVGPSLKKLVLGYTLFVNEPGLVDVLVHCPNLEYLEIRFPRMSYGANCQINIPPDLPTRCPKIHTLCWVCNGESQGTFDLSPIPHMPSLRSLSLTNVPILNNDAFYKYIVDECPLLTSLILTLPHSFQNSGLRSFANLASLRTLELYNCSYNLRPMQLHLLPNLSSVVFHNSTYDCDFETINILTTLPLVKLEIKFQSTLRASQLKEQFLAIMSRKPYRLMCKGNLYDTFCYMLSN